MCRPSCPPILVTYLNSSVPFFIHSSSVISVWQPLLLWAMASIHQEQAPHLMNHHCHLYGRTANPTTCPCSRHCQSQSPITNAASSCQLDSSDLRVSAGYLSSLTYHAWSDCHSLECFSFSSCHPWTCETIQPMSSQIVAPSSTLCGIVVSSSEFVKCADCFLSCGSSMQTYLILCMNNLRSCLCADI